MTVVKPQVAEDYTKTMQTLQPSEFSTTNIFSGDVDGVASKAAALRRVNS